MRKGTGQLMVKSRLTPAYTGHAWHAGEAESREVLN